MTQTPNQPLQVTGDARPSVPTYPCRIYVRTNDDGTVTGRVANLAGITMQAATERDLLSRMTREFKRQVLELLAAESEVPWVEPVPAADPAERVRSIPVHG